MKGKILLLLVIAVAAFFAFNAFFSGGFDAGLAGLRELEQKNNAQEAFLVPITLKEISAYKNGLNSLKLRFGGNAAFSSLLDLKLSIALMQENLLNIGDNFSRADKANPDCSPDSGLFLAKSLSNETAQKADSVLIKRNAFLKNHPAEAALVREISQAKFEGAISSVKNGVEQIQKILLNYC